MFSNKHYFKILYTLGIIDIFNRIYLHNYIFWKAFRFRCPGQQLVLRALYAGDQRHVTSPDQRDLHQKLTAFIRYRNLSFLGPIKRRNCNCDFLIWYRTHEIQVPESHQNWIYLQIEIVWPNQEQLLKQNACGGSVDRVPSPPWVYEDGGRRTQEEPQRNRWCRWCNLPDSMVTPSPATIVI